MKINRLTYCILCILLFFGTACQKEIKFDDRLSIQIKLLNPGFEDSLQGWQIDTKYRGLYGFTADKIAVRNGRLGLNFYASQSHHFLNAPQETPWNGKIYQIVPGLEDGIYTFKAYADAVGEGMYLWANNGAEEKKVKIKSSVNKLISLDFIVKNGIAKIGFACINADGDATYAPYFHADDIELWKK